MEEAKRMEKIFWLIFSIQTRRVRMMSRTRRMRLIHSFNKPKMALLIMNTSPAQASCRKKILVKRRWTSMTLSNLRSRTSRSSKKESLKKKFWCEKLSLSQLTGNAQSRISLRINNLKKRRVRSAWKMFFRKTRIRTKLFQLQSRLNRGL